MEIKQKSDHDLLAELKDLVGQEKNIHVRVIAYLQEVEKRELHLARGYSSLFTFCTEYLGFTEAETHVRIQAMRLSKEIPAISRKIENGELSLTSIAQAQTIFRRRNIDSKAKEAVLKNLENKSTRATERILARLFPNEPKPEKTKPVSQEITRVEFNASRSLMEKIEKLKNLLAHRNFSGRYDLFFEYLADEALKKLEPKGKDNSGSLRAPQVTKKNRYIPASTKRLIWTQLSHGCAYTDPQTGRRCREKHGLEIDHIEEYAKGGTHHPGNLQLLCAAHNQFKSRPLTRPHRKN